MTDWTCEEVRRFFSALAADEVEPPDGLGDHLDNCDSCSQEFGMILLGAAARGEIPAELPPGGAPPFPEEFFRKKFPPN